MGPSAQRDMGSFQYWRSFSPRFILARYFLRCLQLQALRDWCINVAEMEHLLMPPALVFHLTELQVWS